MYQPYKDLLALTKNPPLWYDECGVPRWIKFHPSLVNHIYADEVAYFQIACQNCGKLFNVVSTWSRLDGLWNTKEVPKLSSKDRFIHYGDAPCFGEDGCGVGGTMTSDNIKLLEFWEKIRGEWTFRLKPLPNPVVDERYTGDT